MYFRSHDRSASEVRRNYTPPSKPTKVFVTNLTRNVTKAHLLEIFATFGTIKKVKLETSSAYVYFETPEMADCAIKHLNNGSIDGIVIKVVPVTSRKSTKV